MSNDFTGRSNAARLDHLVAPNPEDRPIVNGCAAEDSCLLRAGNYGFIHIFILFSLLFTFGDVGARFSASLPFRLARTPVQFACQDAVRLYSVSAPLLYSTGSGSTRSCFELKNMAINTIIVDDEKPARDELAFRLKGFPAINV